MAISANTVSISRSESAAALIVGMLRCASLAFGAALLALGTAGFTPARAQSMVQELDKEVRERAAQIEEKLIAWRRDLHEHPELGEQETRTSALVAEHLRKLGLEVKTGVASTGVVALLKGGKPGP